MEAFISAELRGSPNEEVRAHAKATLRLALALQHKRTADYRMAGLCAEATTSVVNILAVLGGRLGRSMQGYEETYSKHIQRTGDGGWP